MNEMEQIFEEIKRERFYIPSSNGYWISYNFRFMINRIMFEYSYACGARGKEVYNYIQYCLVYHQVHSNISTFFW